jgi:hypothetical protein
LHAFSGCDYTAAFSRKGKIQPLSILKKFPKYETTFSKLGNQVYVDESLIKEQEGFVCSLYGTNIITSVSDLRFIPFKKKYEPANVSQPLEKIKSADASLLIPSLPTLILKIKRGNYILSLMWKNAHLSTPSMDSPIKHGWHEEENRYEITWYDGPACPADILADNME